MKTTTIITQPKNESGFWTALITIGEVTIEADIRPSSATRLLEKYEVEVVQDPTGETYNTLKFTEKKRHAAQS